MRRIVMRSFSVFKLLNAFAAVLLLGVATCVTGCTEREVVDVETPLGDVEVNEDTRTGELDVDVDDNETEIAE